MSSNAKPKLKLPSIKANAASVGSDIRHSAGLNSPTAQDTPNTALRNHAAINSPIAADEKSEAEIEKLQNSLLTQVDRPDPSQQPKKEKKAQEPEISRRKESGKKTSSGWCSCFGAAKIEDLDMKPKEIEAVGKAKKQDSRATPEAGNNPNYTDEDLKRESEGLLGPRKPEHRNRKTIVLDLDETLVHSSFKKVPGSDFQVPVEIDNTIHTVYVLKRPYADEFLEMCGRHYEVVLFTASLSKYADPLLDDLDKKRVIDVRLFRQDCVQIGYSYIKDLSQLGRKMSDIMIVDNSPHSYRFQPNNAIPITSWFDDKMDTELKDIIPTLETTLKHIPDVRKILDASRSYQWLCGQAEKE